MKIAIASDHGGLEIKKSIVEYLKSKKIVVEDLGTGSLDSVDYPDFAARVAGEVSGGKADLGILACGTGIGMSITANKFKGIRAAVVVDEYTAKMAKAHNNANILCLGGRIGNPETARKLVDVWLETAFEGDRHNRRLQKISEIEQKNFK